MKNLIIIERWNKKCIYCKKLQEYVLLPDFQNDMYSMMTKRMIITNECEFMIAKLSWIEYDILQYHVKIIH